jgi:hypothetical protein
VAFVAWRTWVAGAVATAAQFNQDVRDNLNAMFPQAATSGTAWTTYTPTLTQSATVTKTSTDARYQVVAGICFVEVYLSLTGAGTANNPILLGLPVTATGTLGMDVGTGIITDTSAAQVFPSIPTLASSTTVNFVDTTQVTGSARQGQSGAAFALALASGDFITASMFYRV